MNGAVRNAYLDKISWEKTFFSKYMFLFIHDGELRSLERAHPTYFHEMYQNFKPEGF